MWIILLFIAGVVIPNIVIVHEAKAYVVEQLGHTITQCKQD